MPKINLSVKLDESIKDRVKQKSNELDVTLSEFSERAIDAFSNFDNEFLKIVKTFSKNTGLPEYLILQNLTTSWFARMDAQSEVWGDNPEFLDEFAFYGDNPVPSEEIYNNLKTNFIREFEFKKDESLLETERFSPDALTEDDKAYMIRRKIGNVWLNSLEYLGARAEELGLINLATVARGKGLVPVGCDKTEISIGRYYSLVMDGKMTVEKFQKWISTKNSSEWISDKE